MYMYELQKIKKLIRMKDILINQIKNNNNQNNFIETNDYVVGNIIKYKLINEEIGEIIKIYKTTRKIKVKTSNNKNIDILKTLIISVKRNNKLENINKQIQEKKIIKISKYVLFNILSNEYIEIN